jgi:hypothetical protein
MSSTQLLSSDEFIRRCKVLYEDRYSFEKTIYKNSRSNVTLTCPDHGDFVKNARSILMGTGCSKCQINWKNYVQRQRLTTAQFIQKARDLHEGFYTYDNTNYTNSRTLITITCPIHGEFEQRAGGHLEGYGCQKCGDTKHGDYRPWFISTYFERFPEKKDIPAILYLLYNSDEKFYKIGITTKKTVEDRIKYMSRYTFEIIDFVSDTMYNVAIAEQQILKDNKHYNPKKRFGGHTECLKNFVDIHQYIPHKDGIPVKEARADNDIRRN